MKNRANCKSLVLFVVIHAMAFVFVYYFCQRNPYYSDDLDIIASLNQYQGNRIQVAVAYSIDYHLHWGGRSIPNFFLALILLSPRLVYNLLNSFVYVLFAMLIYFFAYPFIEMKEKKREFPTLHNGFMAVVYCMLWFFIPTWGGVVIWRTASVAYLWPCTILLIFLYPYYCRLLGKETQNLSVVSKGILSFLYAVAGFLSGANIEPSSCALMVVLLLWLIYMKRNGKTIAIYELIGGIFAVLGFVFLFTAPGIYNRGMTVSNESANIIIRYGFRFIRETYYAAKYLTIPLGLGLSFVGAGHRNKDTGHFWTAILLRENEIVILTVMLLINVFVMTFSPGYAYRILLLPVALSLIIMGRGYKKYVEGKNRFSESILVFMIVLCTLHSNVTAIVRGLGSDEPIVIDMDYYSGSRPEQLF